MADENINDEKAEAAIKKKERIKYIRALVAYFIMGVCNNYGYVVMLSGAYDIISDIEKHYVEQNERNCTQLSTGAILLADIIPSFVIKLTVPFLPLWIHARIVICIALAAGGMLLVAFGTAKWVAICGVAITSITSGLGELTFLQYSVVFDKNVISTWSSGTGGAGVLGAVSYTLFSLISTRVAMLCGLAVPFMLAVAFWGILPKPDVKKQIVIIDEKHEEWKVNFRKKLKLVPGLLQYMIPLSSVYLFEYFINQGLFELVYYENVFIPHPFQYKCLNIIYQIWIMSVLQFLNVVLFTFEVIYYYVPQIWIVFLFTFWEGLLGGSSYVNTYYKITRERNDEEKTFCIGMTAVSDAVGITLAGIFAIPVHNAICKLDKPVRLSF